MYYYKTSITLENECYLPQLAEKDLEAKKPIYERILQNGHSLLDETEPGPERDAVQQKLDDLTNKWNGVKEKADKRTDDLGRLLPLAQTHNDNYVTFSVYLNGAEKKLNGFKQPEMDPEELERQKKELEVSSLLIYICLKRVKVGK